jgi:hypothetical protein
MFWNEELLEKQMAQFASFLAVYNEASGIPDCYNVQWWDN